jgi:hypothetical protein
LPGRRGEPVVPIYNATIVRGVGHGPGWCAAWCSA